MTSPAPQFTASQIARALGKQRQAVDRLLGGVAPSGAVIVGGKVVDAWPVSALPASLQKDLSNRANQLSYASVEELLNVPFTVWRPSLPLPKIAKHCIDSAFKLRRALKNVLFFKDKPDVSRTQRERIGLEDYKREFGQLITDRYLRELIKRTVDRDGGFENWDRLEIYLPDRLAAKEAPERPVAELVNEEFSALDVLIESCLEKPNPSEAERDPIWRLALSRYKLAVVNGENPKSVARRLRMYLFSKAAFLAPSRDALLKAFNRRLAKFQGSQGALAAVGDGRAENGAEFMVPESDLDILRTSAAFSNGGRVDAAWREKYYELSEQTRNRWPFSMEAPRKIHELLVREKVDVLTARHMRGKLTVRRMIGGVQRSWEGIPSMHEWVADDMTSNIEVTRKLGDGTWELFVPQIVAVMDSASRKFVGWAISSDKGPTAELSCAAILDGFKTHGVPSSLGVENGFVFGNALNINGKEDDQGRTVVAGLAQYGCAIRHFAKMNPTSKAELEKAFDLIQQRQERHPGYTGRLQMIDAPEDFKKEKREILSGKVEGVEHRYTFGEFIKRMAEIFSAYNEKPQGGQLNGISPNKAHELLKDAANPPIQFTSELEWLLANARYRVHVKVGGVQFTHYGETIRVRGGRLPSLVGEDLWALVDRSDASLVTFMNLKFADPFTLEVCQKPSASERLIAPGSGILGNERAKIGEHVRAVNSEYNRLIQKHGNPRRDLLAQIRQQPVADQIDPGVRTIQISNRLKSSAAAMNEQRGEIKQKRKNEAARSRNLRTKAARAGVPAILVDDGDEDMREALELRLEAQKEHAREQQRQAGQTEGTV